MQIAEWADGLGQVCKKLQASGVEVSEWDSRDLTLQAADAFFE